MTVYSCIKIFGCTLAIQSALPLCAPSFAAEHFSYAAIVGPDGARNITPTAVNDAGVVAGTYQILVKQHLKQHGFIWSNGVFSSFDPPGSTGTSCSAINNAGTVVGEFLTSNGEESYILSNGNFQIVKHPKISRYKEVTLLSDINDAGIVAGQVESSGGSNTIWFTLNAGKFHDYKTPLFAEPPLINNLNTIAGIIDSGNHDLRSSSLMIKSNGSSRVVALPGAAATNIQGLDDHDMVGGYTQLIPYGTLTAFTFKKGKFTNYTFDGRPPGSGIGHLNKRGDFLLGLFKRNDRGAAAFLIHKKEMLAITPFGHKYYVTNPSALNANDQVVGYYTGYRDKYLGAYIATPLQ